jgi:membrane protease YdiL (CAAX protease family)
MNTTNLIVEFLVTGFQVAFWVILIFLIVFGVDWLTFEKSKDLGIPLIALLIPVAYPIGIFVDNLADFIFRKEDTKIRTKFITDKSNSITRVRTLSGADSPLTKLLEYQKMRIRISRSTFINFMIITLLIPPFIILKLEKILGDKTYVVFFTFFALSIAIVFLAFWTWKDITLRYYERIKKANALIAEVNKKKNE